MKHFLYVLRTAGLIETFRRIVKKTRKSFLLIKGNVFFRFRRNQQEVLNSVQTVKRNWEPIKKHTQSVDIVVCIHNALADVKRCLTSIVKNTSSPYKLILIDDGSSAETQKYLEDFGEKYQSQLLRSDTATGYTYAANRGMRASSAEYVVLLNSDTIVTDGWIDRMIACANHQNKIGIVGPLSNTASWQSIPKIEESGDWAANPLPDGLSVDEMGILISENSVHLYPEMPLLNGFCLMIKRGVIESIGYFDEENFGKGYGEEDDYVLRARKVGWKMALADDVYIYHAQSKSYSSEKRKQLSVRSGKILAKKHGQGIIDEGVQYCLTDRVLNGIRTKTAYLWEREKIIRQGREQFSGKRILFLLPIAKAFGGGNIIILEGMALQKMGVEVSIFNLEGHKDQFEKAYPELSIPIIYGEKEDILKISTRFDAVVATAYHTVEWMKDLKDVKTGYYIQDFEPRMFSKDSKEYQQALESYTLFKNLICFTKTKWNAETVKKETGKQPYVVGCDFDVDLFLPRPAQNQRWPHRPIQIAAMVRPETEYRQPGLTMKILKKILNQYKGMVEVNIFGTTPSNHLFQSMEIDFPWKLYGVIAANQVAFVLNEMDIFLDCSSYQAMGLTVLEAMACGCAVIAPIEGGAGSFIKNDQNGLLVNTKQESEVIGSLRLLIENHQKRAEMQAHALQSVQQFYPEVVSFNLLSVLF